MVSAPLLSPVVPALFVALLAVVVLRTRRAWRRAAAWEATPAIHPDRLGLPLAPRSARTQLGARITLIVILLLTSLLTAVNCYIGYVPTVWALAARVGLASDGPEVVTKVLSAPDLGVGSRSVLVSLPPGYSSGTQRYPVVYLLPGFPGDETTWFRSGQAGQVRDALLARKAIGPVILVAPMLSSSFTHDSECLNEKGGPQEEAFLLTKVIPWVDLSFRTFHTRGDRALGGMSSGAFCALNIALRHDDLFSGVIAHQPYDEPGPDVLQPDLGGDLAAYRANSPKDYAATQVRHHPLRIWLDAPAGDETEPIARRLTPVLQSRGDTVRLTIASGQHHTWVEVQQQFPGALAWLVPHLTHGAP